ncbi:MAG: cell division protein ZapA [Thioploca sp.]|nr:cell division protein ZapA [Thioploca sp.]
MSTSKTIPVNLRVLDKDYIVACPEEERDTLMASAQYLNKKVQEVREGGKVVSTERMVVISALNIIHEYLQYKQQRENSIGIAQNEITRLENKIEFALSAIKL